MNIYVVTWAGRNTAAVAEDGEVLRASDAAAVARVLAEPATRRLSHTENGVIAESIQTVYPGDPDFVPIALEQLPESTVTGPGDWQFPEGTVA